MREVEWHNPTLPNTVSQKILAAVKIGDPMSTGWQTDAVNRARENGTSYDQEVFKAIQGIVEFYETKLIEARKALVSAANPRG